MSEISELMKKLHSSQEMTNKVLLVLWQKEQLNQQNKTPAHAIPTTFNLWNPILPTPTALQIIAASSSRYKVAIANYGPSDIMFAEKWFDPTSILQLFSDPTDPSAITPGYNQAIPIGILPAGANVTINGQRGCWAYSFGSAADASQNAILSIEDSLYAEITAPATVGDDSVASMWKEQLGAHEAPGLTAVN